MLPQAPVCRLPLLLSATSPIFYIRESLRFPRSASLNHGAKRHRPTDTRGLKLQSGSSRAASTGSAPPSSSDTPIRTTIALRALVVLSLGATVAGLYQFYATLTMWPEEVRGDLRAGLRAKQRGDLKLCQRHLARAWETALTLPAAALSPDPHLKVSGIAILLAEVLEAENQLQEAYKVLRDALALFTPRFKSGDHRRSRGFDWPAPSGKERRRAVALALKLGDMAEQLAIPADEEKWLSFAAEVILHARGKGSLDALKHASEGLRSIPTVPSMRAPAIPVAAGGSETAPDKAAHKPGVQHRQESSTDESEDLPLPKWAALTATEYAAPLERLGAFYARQGNVQYALPLFYAAYNTLLTSSGRNSPPPVVNQCRAFQVLNSTAALLLEYAEALESPSTPKSSKDIAPSGADESHSVADGVDEEERARVTAAAGGALRSAQGICKNALETPRTVPEDTSLCHLVFPAYMYNLGVFKERSGRLEAASRAYMVSLTRSREQGLKEGAEEAHASLRRVQRALEKRGESVSSLGQTGNDNEM